jgi:hypothetical protein
MHSAIDEQPTPTSLSQASKHADSTPRRTRKSSNTFTIQPDSTVAMSIDSKKHGPFSVLIDLADLPGITPHAWFIHRSESGSYYAATKIQRKTVFLHQLLLGSFRAGCSGRLQPTAKRTGPIFQARPN